MNFQEDLRNKVKPELNNIFTDKPNSSVGDFGWYCREHALILFILAKMTGHQSDIYVGTLKAMSPEANLNCADDKAGHSWCSIHNDSPVDISLSFKHFLGLPDIPIVYGVNKVLGSPYTVFLCRNDIDEIEAEKLKEQFKEHSYRILYTETGILNVEPEELLDNPYSFILPPPNGFPRFTDDYGTQIFYQISYHCYKLVTEKFKPLFKYRDSISALKKIRERNQNAREEVLKLLKNRRQKI